MLTGSGRRAFPHVRFPGDTDGAHWLRELHPGMFRGVATATTLLALLPATACHSTGRLPLVPSSETRVVGDIRGVVLNEQAGGGRIEFSHVSEVRWTPSELIITGAVSARDDEGRRLRRPGRTMATSFPLEDVSHVLLAEPTHIEIPIGIVLGTLSGIIGFVIVFGLIGGGFT